MSLVNRATARSRRGHSSRATRFSVLASLSLALIAGAACGGGPSGGDPGGLRPAAAQEATALLIDANPAGNSATTVGPVESCFSPIAGESFNVDLIVENVDELLAWAIYIEFDAELLEVVGRDVDLFQAANEGSAVYDVSDPLPGATSPYQIAAADVSDPPTPDSGSGVLGRLTFRAKADGESPLTFARLDFEGDGTLDRAPFLRNAAARSIGDEDGDGFFDGEATGAEIAIGAECEDTGSTPIDESDGSESSATGVMIAAGAGAGLLVVFGVAGAAIWRRRNGRAVTDT